MPDGLRASPAQAGSFAGLQFQVEENRSGLMLDQLFGVAHRLNPNRKALLVSRVLGKHVPVDPAMARLVGRALADLVAESLGAPPSTHVDLAAAAGSPALAAAAVARSAGNPAPIGHPVTVLGYAETATALGHLVRDGLAGARYLHSTRRTAGNRKPLLRFEEEHSHAPSHAVFHRDGEVLAGNAPLVLVDDELTTGRTVANTIAAVHARSPRQRYLVAALLDWRPPEWRRKLDDLAARLGTRIDTVALVTGTVAGTPVTVDGAGSADAMAPCRLPAPVEFHEVGPLGPPSRLGWDEEHQRDLEAALGGVVERLAGARSGGPALCVGTEEFMYPPLRVAGELGPDVVFQSTTRSPIKASAAAGYPVRAAATFPDPIEPHREGFLYNLVPGRYDDIFVFLDEAVPRHQVSALAAALAGAASSRVHVVTCAGRA